MKNWYKCVAPFGYSENTFDAPGDTYHFWWSVLAGISSQENREEGFYEKVTGLICDLVYPNTETATKILRHSVYKHSGEVHPGIDTLGYNVGRALVNYEKA